MSTPAVPTQRTLSRAKIVATAIELADQLGLEATSMRRIAEELSVTPMALYAHIGNREELINAMVDAVIEQIDLAGAGTTWKDRVRTVILASRQVILRHDWATTAIETRTEASATVLRYMDSLMGLLRDGGLSFDLIHHAMHALSTRMWGFTREVFPTPQLPADAEQRNAALESYSQNYPNIIGMTVAIADSGGTCDGDAEFSFTLELLLDGIDQLHMAGWTAPALRHRVADEAP